MGSPVHRRASLSSSCPRGSLLRGSPSQAGATWVQVYRAFLFVFCFGVAGRWCLVSPDGDSRTTLGLWPILRAPWTVHFPPIL